MADEGDKVEPSAPTCLADPNFAVICSFLDKFSTSIGILNPSFYQLQEMLEDQDQVSQSLVDLHVKLLRKARKCFTVDKWEKTLIRFAHSYSQQDGWELERFGYKKASLGVKIRLLKTLLETQFDMNVKFKNEINKIVPTELRIEPLGKDENGLTYWCQFDPTCNVRVYREDVEEESWDLVAQDRQGLVSLIDDLSNGEGQHELESILNAEENEQEAGKTLNDTGQENEETNDEDDDEDEEEVEEDDENGNEEVDEEEEEEVEHENDEPVSEESEKVIEDVPKVEQNTDNGDSNDNTKDIVKPTPQPVACEDEKPPEATKKEIEKEVICDVPMATESVPTVPDKVNKEEAVSTPSTEPKKAVTTDGSIDLCVKAPPQRPAPSHRPGSKLEEIFKTKMERSMCPYPNDKTSILSQMAARFNSVNNEAEDLTVSVAKKPRIDNEDSVKTFNDQPHSSKTDVVVGEAIEEKPMLFQGEGSGAECDAGNSLNDVPSKSSLKLIAVLNSSSKDSITEALRKCIIRDSSDQCHSETPLNNPSGSPSKSRDRFSENTDLETDILREISVKNCDSWNVRSTTVEPSISKSGDFVFEASEEIVEDVMYFSGCGAGRDCETGNSEAPPVTKPSTSEENADTEKKSTKKLWSIDAICSSKSADKNCESKVTNGPSAEKVCENSVPDKAKSEKVADAPNCKPVDELEPKPNVENGDKNGSKPGKSGEPGQRSVLLSNIIEVCLNNNSSVKDTSNKEIPMGSMYQNLFSAKNIHGPPDAQVAADRSIKTKEIKSEKVNVPKSGISDDKNFKLKASVEKLLENTKPLKCTDEKTENNTKSSDVSISGQIEKSTINEALSAGDQDKAKVASLKKQNDDAKSSKGKDAVNHETEPPKNQKGALPGKTASDSPFVKPELTNVKPKGPGDAAQKKAKNLITKDYGIAKPNVTIKEIQKKDLQDSPKDELRLENANVECPGDLVIKSAKQSDKCDDNTKQEKLAQDKVNLKNTDPSLQDKQESKTANAEVGRTKESKDTHESSSASIKTKTLIPKQSDDQKSTEESKDTHESSSASKKTKTSPIHNQSDDQKSTEESKDALESSSSAPRKPKISIQKQSDEHNTTEKSKDANESHSAPKKTKTPIQKQGDDQKSTEELKDTHESSSASKKTKTPIHNQSDDQKSTEESKDAHEGSSASTKTKTPIQEQSDDQKSTEESKNADEGSGASKKTKTPIQKQSNDQKSTEEPKNADEGSSASKKTKTPIQKQTDGQKSTNESKNADESSNSAPKKTKISIQKQSDGQNTTKSTPKVKELGDSSDNLTIPKEVSDGEGAKQAKSLVKEKGVKDLHRENPKPSKTDEPELEESCVRASQKTSKDSLRTNIEATKSELPEKTDVEKAKEPPVEKSEPLDKIAEEPKDSPVEPNAKTLKGSASKLGGSEVSEDSSSKVPPVNKSSTTSEMTEIAQVPKDSSSQEPAKEAVSGGKVLSRSKSIEDDKMDVSKVPETSDRKSRRPNVAKNEPTKTVGNVKNAKKKSGTQEEIETIVKNEPKTEADVTAAIKLESSEKKGEVEDGSVDSAAEPKMKSETEIKSEEGDTPASPGQDAAEESVVKDEETTPESKSDELPSSRASRSGSTSLSSTQPSKATKTSDDEQASKEVDERKSRRSTRSSTSVKPLPVKSELKPTKGKVNDKSKSSTAKNEEKKDNSKTLKPLKAADKTDVTPVKVGEKRKRNSQQDKSGEDSEKGESSETNCKPTEEEVAKKPRIRNRARRFGRRSRKRPASAKAAPKKVDDASKADKELVEDSNECDGGKKITDEKLEQAESDDDIPLAKRGRESTNASKSEKSEEPTAKKKRCPKRPTVLGLTETDLQSVQVPEEGDEGGGRMRASRRIAMQKIKEEADRRAVEDAIQDIDKNKRKKGKDKKGNLKKESSSLNERHGKDKSKGKHKSKSDSEEEQEEDGKKDGKKKAKKRGFKYNINKPWASSSDDDDENLEEEEDDHLEFMGMEDEDEPVGKVVSDHEFSCDEDLGKDEGEEALPVRRARTAIKEKTQKTEDGETSGEEEPQADLEDYKCEKCGGIENPEWILLCDTCDKGYHASCLKPPLMLIPEGDWHCPVCQHATLVQKLKQVLRTFEQHTKRRENEELRRKRLAYVGISLANVLPENAGSKVKKPEQKKYSGSSAEQSSSEEDSDSDSSEGSEEDEPVYQLRQRRSAVQSYRFNDYDQLIDSAIQDEMVAAGSVVPPLNGSGAVPPIRNENTVPVEHVENEESMKSKPDEEEETVKVSEEKGEDDTEEKDFEENWRPRVVSSTPFGRKKPKKLCNLDVESDDQNDSDEDFKGSSSDEEDDDFSNASDDSGDFRRSRQPLRRSGRARHSRIDREFINDDSDESYSPRTKKKKRQSWDESETSSDRSWGRRKKRVAVRSSYSKSKSKSKKKKKSKSYNDSDSDVPKKKPRAKKPKVRYGLSEDEDDGPLIRTRGKKMNYTEIHGSDTEEEERINRIKGRKTLSDMEAEDEEFVLDQEEEEEFMSGRGQVRKGGPPRISSDEDSDKPAEGKEKAEEKPPVKAVISPEESEGESENSKTAPEQPPKPTVISKVESQTPAAAPPHPVEPSLPVPQPPVARPKIVPIATQRLLAPRPPVRPLIAPPHRRIIESDDEELEDEEEEELDEEELIPEDEIIEEDEERSDEDKFPPRKRPPPIPSIRISVPGRPAASLQGVNTIQNKLKEALKSGGERKPRESEALAKLREKLAAAASRPNPAITITPVLSTPNPAKNPSSTASKVLPFPSSPSPKAEPIKVEEKDKQASPAPVINSIRVVNTQKLLAHPQHQPELLKRNRPDAPSVIRGMLGPGQPPGASLFYSRGSHQRLVCPPGMDPSRFIPQQRHPLLHPPPHLQHQQRRFPDRYLYGPGGVYHPSVGGFYPTAPGPTPAAYQHQDVTTSDFRDTSSPVDDEHHYQGNAPPPVSQPVPSTDGRGEFGGLVSYFSSQREEDGELET